MPFKSNSQSPNSSLGYLPDLKPYPSPEQGNSISVFFIIFHSETKYCYFSIRAQLNCVVEAVNVLIMEKNVFMDMKQIQDAFNVLNPIQIMHLLDSYQPDE